MVWLLLLRLRLRVLQHAAQLLRCLRLSLPGVEDELLGLLQPAAHAREGCGGALGLLRDERRAGERLQHGVQLEGRPRGQHARHVRRAQHPRLQAGGRHADRAGQRGRRVLHLGLVIRHVVRLDIALSSMRDCMG